MQTKDGKREYAAPVGCGNDCTLVQKQKAGENERVRSNHWELVHVRRTAPWTVYRTRYLYAQRPSPFFPSCTDPTFQIVQCMAAGGDLEGLSVGL